MKYYVLKPLRYGRAVQPVGAVIEPDAAEAAALQRAGLVRPVPDVPAGGAAQRRPARATPAT
jgi:hypothetical protein